MPLPHTYLSSLNPLSRPSTPLHLLTSVDLSTPPPLQKLNSYSRPVSPFEQVSQVPSEDFCLTFQIKMDQLRRHTDTNNYSGPQCRKGLFTPQATPLSSPSTKRLLESFRLTEEDTVDDQADQMEIDPFEEDKETIDHPIQLRKRLLSFSETVPDLLTQTKSTLQDLTESENLLYRSDTPVGASSTQDMANTQLGDTVDPSTPRSSLNFNFMDIPRTRLNKLSTSSSSSSSLNNFRITKTSSVTTTSYKNYTTVKKRGYRGDFRSF
ncbi:hypothetical protein WICPIJ_002036 [Wickerhamomyces pijperi]|uniref:Uncharacterized protein n=1 Tax=Wickerhamomyces pijperi TaxID=599730 RepID=A0A9P8TQ12_WICPI|nr:hypothetical protein WICPIJ_002036 [Wickerhamomyces pijperi]